MSRATYTTRAATQLSSGATLNTKIGLGVRLFLLKFVVLPQKIASVKSRGVEVYVYCARGHKS